MNLTCVKVVLLLLLELPAVVGLVFKCREECLRTWGYAMTEFVWAFQSCIRPPRDNLVIDNIVHIISVSFCSLDHRLAAVGLFWQFTIWKLESQKPALVTIEVDRSQKEGVEKFTADQWQCISPLSYICVQFWIFKLVQSLLFWSTRYYCNLESNKILVNLSVSSISILFSVFFVYLLVQPVVLLYTTGSEVAFLAGWIV